MVEYMRAADNSVSLSLTSGEPAATKAALLGPRQVTFLRVSRTGARPVRSREAEREDRPRLSIVVVQV